MAQDTAGRTGPVALRLGAIVDGRGATFTVWAPIRERVTVALLGVGEFPLTRDAEGYFSGHVAVARPGHRYWYLLDETLRRPDPASRFQPEGPEGPSEIVDPRRFTWTDDGWKGPDRLDRQIIYELHIGTFTREGTWAAAAGELPALADLGITTLELMPIAEFPGRFGWGYDGVDLFAPTRRYGTPDAVRRFIDEAHRLGLAVVLDVVFNHLGPSGNFLKDFSPEYFTDRYENEWGESINFDGDRSGPVRAFYIENAAYWIEEFHFDGLRLDATQAIHDRSTDHIVRALTRAARRAAGDRTIFVVAENEPQDTSLLRDLTPARDGIDALWNDDWHHSAVVALTGRRSAYFTDYEGTASEFVSMARHGFLYQGQWYAWQHQPRGTPSLGIRHSAFVNYLENHDQVANTGLGWRLHHTSAPALWRAMTALLLLGPGLPMLFQGQEYATASRFCYFADHEPSLSEAVTTGRAEFLRQFPPLVDPEMQAALPLPSDPRTFEASQLDDEERRRPNAARALHGDLIALRRSDPVLSSVNTSDVLVDGAALGGSIIVLRMSSAREARLLIVNLGADSTRAVLNEPLLAPLRGCTWGHMWSSERPRYGGSGAIPFTQCYPWTIPARSATLLRSTALKPLESSVACAPHS